MFRTSSCVRVPDEFPPKSLTLFRQGRFRFSDTSNRGEILGQNAAAFVRFLSQKAA